MEMERWKTKKENKERKNLNFVLGRVFWSANPSNRSLQVLGDSEKFEREQFYSTAQKILLKFKTSEPLAQ